MPWPSQHTQELLNSKGKCLSKSNNKAKGVEKTFSDSENDGKDQNIYIADSSDDEMPASNKINASKSVFKKTEVKKTHSKPSVKAKETTCKKFSKAAVNVTKKEELS